MHEVKESECRRMVLWVMIPDGERSKCSVLEEDQVSEHDRLYWLLM